MKFLMIMKEMSSYLEFLSYWFQGTKCVNMKIIYLLIQTKQNIYIKIWLTPGKTQPQRIYLLRVLPLKFTDQMYL